MTQLESSIAILEIMREERFPFIATKDEQDSMDVLLELGRGILEGSIRICDKENTDCGGNKWL